MIMSNQFLSNKDIIRLGNSDLKSDRLIVANYVISGRIARAVQDILEKLQIDPSSIPKVQRQLCETIYSNLFIVPQQEIMDYIESVKLRIEENSIDGRYYSDESTTIN
jgi:hypothetical protein